MQLHPGRDEPSWPAVAVAIGRSSSRMEHAVVSVSQNAVVAESHSTLVFIEYEMGKSLPLPAEIRRAMEQLEGRPLT